jgi:hypothetical protein
VTRQMARRYAKASKAERRYAKASKAEKGKVLDELRALTGRTRRHAHRALTGALERPMDPVRRPRPRIYDGIPGGRTGWSPRRAERSASRETQAARRRRTRRTTNQTTAARTRIGTR